MSVAAANEIIGFPLRKTLPCCNTAQILDACMPRLLPLPTSHPAAAAASSGAVPSAAAASSSSGASVEGSSGDVAHPSRLRRLQSLHRRLLMLQAARRHAADGLDEGQVSAWAACKQNAMAMQRDACVLCLEGCKARVVRGVEHCYSHGSTHAVRSLCAHCRNLLHLLEELLVRLAQP